MNYYLAEIILAASNSDGEETFWMQLLVLVILAALVGIGSLIKTRANRLKRYGRDYPEYAGAPGAHSRHGDEVLIEPKGKGLGIFLRIKRPKTVIAGSGSDGTGGNMGRQAGPRDVSGKRRNLTGGMELLGQDFLVEIVENTEGDNSKDVTMRELSFDELLRRGRLKAADSGALKIYVKNEGNLYSKKAQCEAMKELAERTSL